MKFLGYLSCVLALSLVPSFASADEPSVAAQARQRVEDGLVKPLSEIENRSSHFSRVRVPPRERRARITQAAASVDAAGRGFMRFAIDVKFGGGEWRENDVVGCVYVGSGDLYVKLGDAFRPASILLGKDVAAVPGVCQAPPAT